MVFVDSVCLWVAWFCFEVSVCSGFVRVNEDCFEWFDDFRGG